MAHEVPYNNVVPSDPTLEEMRLKVVEEKYRPPVDTTWKNDEVSINCVWISVDFLITNPRMHGLEREKKLLLDKDNKYL